MNKPEKNFLKALNGEKTDRLPFWFMRQAGRYLPEYRELRAKAGSFLDMAYNPDHASEVTIQPLRRFNMDAAIIFSDILVIPHALGQDLKFVAGEGPKLPPLESGADIAKLSYENFDRMLNPVYEALAKTASAMQEEGFKDTALIGFCGAPWTVACYMIEGQGSKDYMKVKKFAYAHEEDFSRLIDLLVEASAKYLINQIKAGAEAVQIFDSWAGALDSPSFARWVIEPTKKIVELVRKEFPDTPIIGFPRCAGINYIAYAKNTGVTAMGLDTSVDTFWAAKELQTLLPVQGNLDPACLYAGGARLIETAQNIVEDLGAKPFVFNLGHGIHKDTPISHVEELVKYLKEVRI